MKLKEHNTFLQLLSSNLLSYLICSIYLQKNLRTHITLTNVKSSVEEKEGSDNNSDQV